MTVNTEPVAQDAISCGPLWVSPTEFYEVRVRGQTVPMSVPLIRLLAKLLEAKGRVVTREEILELKLENRLRPHTRAVDVRVHRLRRALGPLGTYVLSVQGLGYRIDVFGLSQES